MPVIKSKRSKILVCVLVINIILISIIAIIQKRKDTGVTYAQAAKLFAYGMAQESYIDTLEQLCIDKTMVCEKYAHIIQLKEKEIQLQKEINTLINEIQAAMKRQNERIRDLKKAIGENNNVIRSDSWIKRLRKRFQW